MGHAFGEPDSPSQVGVMAYASDFNNMSNVTVSNGRNILKRDYRQNKKRNLNSETGNNVVGARTITITGEYNIGNFMNGKKIKLEKK